MKRLIVARIATVGVLVFLLVLAANVQVWAFEFNSDEQRMFDLVNREREVRGLPILKPDSTVTGLARKQSQEMVELNYFAHESPVRGDLLNRIMAFKVRNWIVAGENLAGAPSVETAHNALMQSEKHRENILRTDFTHLGVGVIDGGLYGKMFTQEFITYKQGYSPVAVGNIYGRIVDIYGRPVAEAAVRIDMTVIPTNAFGEFRFTLVQPGIYTIYYDAVGFAGQVQEYITVNSGSTANTPMVIMAQSR